MDPTNRYSMPEEAAQEIIKLHAPLISNPHPLQLEIPPKVGTSTIEPTGPPTPQPGHVINFGVVAPGIYRSSFPQPCNLDHLQSLKLKTIITMVDEPYSPESTNFVKTNGIVHLRIPIKAHKSFERINPLDKIAEVQLVLKDTSRHPVLIHCNKGKHRTGCMIATYRKLNNEPEDSIIKEYRHFAGAKARPWDEHYITHLDVPTLTESMRVGPSSLAGTLLAKAYAERMAKLNRLAQDALQYGTPPRSSGEEYGDEGVNPWLRTDVKWRCDDGTSADMNPS
ncbi:MAG: hypothetical protein Q9195_004020 [Heterodermia aff. obscurata]